MSTPKDVIEKALRLMNTGKHKQAKTIVQPLIKAFPSHPDINYLFATILVSTKEFHASFSHFKLYLKVHPGALNCWNDLGCAYKDNGQNEEAIDSFKKALSISPKYHHALTNLASTYFQIKQYENAKFFIKQAINIEPKVASSFLLLGNIFKKLKESSDAIQAYKQSTKIDSHFYQGYYNLALMFKDSSNLEEALAYSQLTLSYNKQYQPGLMLYGEINEQLGEIGLATAAYKQCIQINPNYTRAYWGLANIGATFDESIILMMKSLTKQSLKDEEQVFLFFSLGKVMEEKQEFELAFQFLEKANQVKNQTINYQSDWIENMVTRFSSFFTADVLEKLEGRGDQEISPIFIIGMPRSGTSLVEQILSSTNLVEGGGELETSLTLLFEELPKLTGSNWDASLDLLNEKTLKILAEKYQEKNADLTTANAYFTDKLPFNFALVGLLSLIFPNAKFIHTFKHPLDSCLSCYKQYFTKGQLFSYDLDNIADYYLQYEKIMNHWGNVCPEKIFHMSYENLINSPEAELIKMFSFLNIPWEQDCIHFHKNKRIVKTASTGQVRRSFYKSALNRWVHYRDNLKPIMEKVMENHSS